MKEEKKELQWLTKINNKNLVVSDLGTSGLARLPTSKNKKSRKEEYTGNLFPENVKSIM